MKEVIGFNYALLHSEYWTKLIDDRWGEECIGTPTAEMLVTVNAVRSEMTDIQAVLTENGVKVENWINPTNDLSMNIGSIEGKCIGCWTATKVDRIEPNWNYYMMSAGNLQPNLVQYYTSDGVGIGIRPVVKLKVGVKLKYDEESYQLYKD